MIKEAKVCATFCWNPRASGEKLLVAAASVVGAMGDDFDSAAHIELREVDLADTTSRDMPVVARASMPDRAHCVHWSHIGGGGGTIAAGLADGTVRLWSADALMKQYTGVDEQDDVCEDATLCTVNVSEGKAIRSLMFNPHKNVLATGGESKELNIYAIDTPSDPKVVPALAKSTHPTEITDLRWNHKFDSILGSVTAGGSFHLWDLRTGRQTHTIPGAQHGAANAMAWHRDGITQVAIARDATAMSGGGGVVQIWDLKKAVAPIRELRGHSGNVSAVSWCPDDSSLVVSCGADGRALCWNVATGELIGKVADSQDNFMYDAQWCPRVPAVVCTSSFDGTLSVHSAQDPPAVEGTSAPTQSPQCKSAPKWLTRPCSASFGYGGKIVLRSKRPAGAPATAPITTLTLRTVPGAQEQTQQSIAAEDKFRQELAEKGNDPTWIAEQSLPDVAAIAASNAANTREPLLGYLGVQPETVSQELSEAVESATFGSADQEQMDHLVSRALACGKVDAAITLMLAAGRYDDAFALATLLGGEAMTRVRSAYLDARKGSLRFARYLDAVTRHTTPNSPDKEKAFTEIFEHTATEMATEGDRWKEVLALAATFSSQTDFTRNAKALGDALRPANPEAAATCLVTGGFVDDVAAIWRPTYSAQKLVHAVSILETVTRRQAQGPAYGEALAEYSEDLANHHNYVGALLYGSRAAQIGIQRGAIVADRAQQEARTSAGPSQQQLPQQPFPFPLQILPESNDPTVVAIARAQQVPAPVVRPSPQPQQYAPQQQQQQRQAFQPPAHQQQQYQQQQQQAQQMMQQPGAQRVMNAMMPDMRSQMNTNIAAQTQQPQQYQPPQQQPPQQQAPQQQQQLPQHFMPDMRSQMNTNIQNQPPQRPPMPQQQFQDPQRQIPPQQPAAPPLPPPQQQQQQQQYSGYPQQSQQPPSHYPPQPQQPPHQYPAPPQQQAPPPPPGQPTAPPPPTQSEPPKASSSMPPPPLPSQQAPQQQQQQPPTPAAPPQQQMMQPSVGSTTRSSASPLGASRSSGSSALPAFTYDISGINNPDGRTVAGTIINAVNAVTERRKRESLEKAARELCVRLEHGQISQSLIVLLGAFAAAIGTPQSREAWRKITDAHFQEVQPFLNLKFL